MSASPLKLSQDAAPSADIMRRMNRMHRRQRRICDAARRYDLLGRDRITTGLRTGAGCSVPGVMLLAAKANRA